MVEPIEATKAGSKKRNNYNNIYSIDITYQYYIYITYVIIITLF